MEKTVKPLNKEEFKEKIKLIVDQLFIQNQSRELVTELVNELNSSFGLKKPVVRAVASSVYKKDKNEVEAKNEEILELLNILD